MASIRAAGDRCATGRRSRGKRGGQCHRRVSIRPDAEAGRSGHHPTTRAAGPRRAGIVRVLSATGGPPWPVV